MRNPLHTLGALAVCIAGCTTGALAQTGNDVMISQWNAGGTAFIAPYYLADPGAGYFYLGWNDTTNLVEWTATQDLSATATPTFAGLVVSGDILPSAGTEDLGSASYNFAQGYIDALFTDSIDESTSSAGVTIEGVLLEDDYIQFDPQASAPSYVEGIVYYDDDDHTLTMYSDISGPSLQIGQESWVRVVNRSGAQIDNGDVVYIAGAYDGEPTIELAEADDAVKANKTIGIATHNIADSASGYVTTHGLVRGLNLAAFSAGDTIYLSTTAGDFTATAPGEPHTDVRLGAVLNNSASVGVLFVTVVPEPIPELIYGTMSTQAGSTSEATTDATPRLVAAWNTDDLAAGMTVDHTDDTIKAQISGVYSVTIGCSFSGSNNGVFQTEIYIYDDSAATWNASGFACDRKLGTTGDVGSTAITAIVDLDTDDKIGLYHSASTGNAFTVTEAQMAVHRLGD